ncbi:urease accessory protein UreF [Jiangella anatolica]|uniref:Urease accessory protein UreF n=1 Tax=Jiangella anatolica TaxID=2670374 RepID=A0A2W2C570_9ACTN|nr:urease accessory UreF family protein [Jiangella anatolica]PZF80866.1 urease accessory protein UreF [Jiangella anatolica]
MPPHPELLLMLLADARLPAAGHTQSGTAEAALAHGLAAAELPGYVSARLASVTCVEAGTAVVARAVLLRSGGTAQLADVAAAWAARTPSPALREAARVQARALLRLADRLWPEAGALQAVRELIRPCRAVVLGAVAAHVGLGAAALARLVGYDDVQTVCAAALKLVPMDPAVVTGWVHDALPDIDQLAATVAELTEPASIPAVGSPQIEAWAQAHAATSRRLFRA